MSGIMIHWQASEAEAAVLQEHDRRLRADLSAAIESNAALSHADKSALKQKIRFSRPLGSVFSSPKMQRERAREEHERDPPPTASGLQEWRLQLAAVGGYSGCAVHSPSASHAEPTSPGSRRATQASVCVVASQARPPLPTTAQALSAEEAQAAPREVERSSWGAANAGLQEAVGQCLDGWAVEKGTGKGKTAAEVDAMATVEVVGLEQPVVATGDGKSQADSDTANTEPAAANAGIGTTSIERQGGVVELSKLQLTCPQVPLT